MEVRWAIQLISTQLPNTEKYCCSTDGWRSLVIVSQLKQRSANELATLTKERVKSKYYLSNGFGLIDWHMMRIMKVWHYDWLVSSPLFRGFFLFIKTSASSLNWSLILLEEDGKFEKTGEVWYSIKYIWKLKEKHMQGGSLLIILFLWSVWCTSWAVAKRNSTKNGWKVWINFKRKWSHQWLVACTEPSMKSTQTARLLSWMLMVLHLTWIGSDQKQFFFLYQKESQLLLQKVLAQMPIQPSKNIIKEEAKASFWWANRTMMKESLAG